MNLHSRGLRYFDMIRRRGSIREAARHLHVSSSAVNRQLLQLEEDIGSPLFERMPSGMRLTPAGEILARHVTTVLQDGQRMVSELDALRGLRRGSVDVVAVESLTASFLPELLQTMHSRYPAVTLRVQVCGSAQAARLVALGDADVALGFVLQRNEALRQLALSRFALGAVVKKSHPLARLTNVSLADCARHPLVLPSEELSIHWELKTAMANLKRPLNVVLETGSFELMKEFAARGAAVAFTNRFGIERELRAGLLRHLPLKPAIYSGLGVYVRAGRSPTPALDAFTRLAAEAIETRQTEE
ncbi:MAG: LysR family transcriptional regulator [Burkholderiales bacterium]